MDIFDLRLNEEFSDVRWIHNDLSPLKTRGSCQTDYEKMKLVSKLS